MMDSNNTTAIKVHINTTLIPMRIFIIEYHLSFCNVTIYSSFPHCTLTLKKENTTQSQFKKGNATSFNTGWFLNPNLKWFSKDWYLSLIDICTNYLNYVKLDCAAQITGLMKIKNKYFILNHPWEIHILSARRKANICGFFFNAK